MNVQAKAVEAVKRKRLGYGKTMIYINKALIAKQHGKVKNLTDFWNTNPELQAAIKRGGWYAAARKNAAIVKAFNLKSPKIDCSTVDDAPPDDDVPKPPEPRKYLGQEGDQHIFACGCKLHIQAGCHQHKRCCATG
jgi:hypothetical protein